MLKRDIKKLKEKLGVNDDYRLLDVEIRLCPDENDLVYLWIYNSKESIYKSYYGMRIEKYINVEETESKLVHALKDIFGIEKVFVYTDYYSTLNENYIKRYNISFMKEDGVYSIFDTDCRYIIAVPKKFNVKKLDEKIFNNKYKVLTW